MENKAHYALIGTFVLLALLATVFFMTWLSGRQFDQTYDEYTVEFTGAVRGLSKGSEVRLNGLNVGEVTRLNFDPGNPNRVFVTVQVIDGAPIFEDGFAQLEPLGLTGLNYIQINPGLASLSRMNPDTQKLPGRMSQFDTIIEGGESIIDSTTLAVRKVNILLRDESIADFQDILRNLNRVTSNLNDVTIDSEQINNTLLAWEKAGKDTSLAALAVRDTAERINQLVDSEVTPVIRSASTAIDTATLTMNDISVLAKDGSLTAQDLRTAINRLSSAGLADLEETTSSLRELMITLNTIADQLERSPAQFLAGGDQEVMELPQ